MVEKRGGGEELLLVLVLDDGTRARLRRMCVVRVIPVQACRAAHRFVGVLHQGASERVV